MHKSIRLDGLVAEPRTIARAPFATAHHAELRRAAARDVIAALDQFDHMVTIVAALPSLLLRNLMELQRRRIFRTFAASRVPFAIAGAAHFRLAAVAGTVFPPRVGGAGGGCSDVFGFDPGAAAAGGAVDAVFGGVFLVFAVPAAFEFVVVELVDVFEVDVFCCAAFGGHVLWVG